MKNIDLNNAPFVLLDDCRPRHKANPSYLFHSPERLIVANDFTDLSDAFNAIDAAVAEGLHVAGWIAYEAASFFEQRLSTVITRKSSEPLIWMMATKHRQRLSSKDVEVLLHNSERGNKKRANLIRKGASQTETEYAEAIQAIHDYINAGDVYQINHTLPIPLELDGCAVALYKTLRDRQPVAYGAFIDTGEHQILSLSPELFISREANTLIARPMKGTAARGNTAAEDAAIQQILRTDEKSQAENLMIVDLIRNDLSRISQPGSVSVPTLFEVEQYPTLHQMVTTVTAEAQENLTPSQMLSAMFPCGSVTGAPKLRAMEIIHSLEAGPRGVYCGTIGHFSPKTEHCAENWCLNVPIRTLIFGADKKGRINVGSGIVADSAATSEYNECLLKASFINKAPLEFCLIETMKLEQTKIAYRAEHLARLKTSTDYFSYPFDEEHINGQLDDHISAVSHDEGVRRLRLLLDKHGALSISSETLKPSKSAPMEVALSNTPTDSSDPFLFHKTTNRPLYAHATEAAQKMNVADVLFFNERAELTEGAISSVFIEIGGTLFTPPLDAGLLPGVFRQNLLSSKKAKVRTLSLEDLKTADAIYLGNALRGLRQVILSEKTWSFPR